jgi:DNA-binding PadR family transcriptional regulator
MLRYAILTLLAENASTGYDLSKAFSASVTYVWPAQQSQVYPELHRLEREGLVEATTIEQTGKPDKRVYNMTADGRRALEEWIVTPPDPPAFRDAFQLRALNFGRINIDQALKLLAQQKAHLMGRIETLEQAAQLLEATGHTPGEPMNPNVGWRVVVEAGLSVLRAYRDWCDWATKQLTTSAAAAQPSRAPRASSQRVSTRSKRRTKSTR